MGTALLPLSVIKPIICQVPFSISSFVLSASFLNKEWTDVLPDTRELIVTEFGSIMSMTTMLYLYYLFGVLRSM